MALIQTLKREAHPLGGSWIPDYEQLLPPPNPSLPSLVESDPSRGLYYLEWPAKGPKVTWFLTQAALEAPDSTDHFRWEWNQNQELLGLEFQTHFKEVLPGASAPAWENYLRSFFTKDKN